MIDAREKWPKLPLAAWRDTYATLHLWTQIVGKIRLKYAPSVNHWWSSVLYVNSRGLTTSLIPYGNGDNAFEIQFDFIDHVLEITTADGSRRACALAPKSVSSFYREVLEILFSLGLKTEIYPVPQELPFRTPCDVDEGHRNYNREYATRFFRTLLQANRLLNIFRAGFIGKCSPVHFFWGSFDLAVTRFSGKRAPDRKGIITSEAYSHEVISHGFWPGSGNIQGPAFYAYAAPEPEGYGLAEVQPPHAFYNPPSKNFILMYDEVLASSNPDQMVLNFLQSTYETAANLAKWDRENLEKRTRFPLKKAA